MTRAADCPRLSRLHRYLAATSVFRALKASENKTQKIYNFMEYQIKRHLNGNEKCWWNDVKTL